MVLTLEKTLRRSFVNTHFNINHTYEAYVYPILNLCAYVKMARKIKKPLVESYAARKIVFYYQNPGHKHEQLQKYLDNIICKTQEVNST